MVFISRIRHFPSLHATDHPGLNYREPTFCPGESAISCIYLREIMLGTSFDKSTYGLLSCRNIQTKQEAFPAHSYGLMVLSAAPYVSSFLVSTVTRVIYIRISASLLPDDDEPVIPYDRGFGGRVNNGSVSPLIILNACRTMSLDNYLRYLRTVTDVAFYEMGWLVSLLCIVSVEVALFWITLCCL